MFRETEYSPEEKRVAEYIDALTGIGGGDDPIGFLIASHAVLANRVQKLRKALETAKIPHWNCKDDPWFSCPLSSGGNPDKDIDQTKCNCGAEEHNRKIEQVLNGMV